jgi:hypothetical protein
MMALGNCRENGLSAKSCALENLKIYPFTILMELTPNANLPGFGARVVDLSTERFTPYIRV